MRIGGPNELAQWVLPTREGLSSIELVLTAEGPNLHGDVIIRIEALPDAASVGLPHGEWPATLLPLNRRVVLRDVRIPAGSLPVGSAFGTGRGNDGEQWTRVGFEPIVPSVARPLLIAASYPDGGTQPGTRVSTLARFPSTGPRSALYVNTFKADGTLLIRLANDETNAAGVRRVMANVADRLPFGGWSRAVSGTLVTACGILWTAIVVGVVLPGRRNSRAVCPRP
jgi:hypothetical protein